MAETRKFRTVEEMETPLEYLGYIGDRMSFVPVSESEGSFLGGNPVWAGDKSCESPKCHVCGHAMVQVTQMWAPLELFSRRALHLFVCSRCRSPPGVWKVIRSHSQTPLPDDGANNGEGVEGEEEDAKETKKDLPAVSIKEMAQIDDDMLDALLAQNAQRTKNAGKNNQKKTKKKKKKKKIIRQPIWEGTEVRACWLEVVEKRAPKRKGISEKQAEEAAAAMERLELEAAKDKESWAGEVYESGSRESKTFRVFQKALQKDPQRVIRYQLGATPLWISEPVPEAPNCARCHRRTVFEMQLLPTFLYLGGAERLWEEQTSGAVPDVELPDDGDVVDENAPEIEEGQQLPPVPAAASLPELIRAPLPEFGACVVFCCPDETCGGDIAEQGVVTQMPE